MDTINFWAKFVPDSQSPVSKKLSVSDITMFGLTYSCESAFSAMNAIKSEHRSVFTDQHLQNATLIALHIHHDIKETVSHFTLSAVL